MEEKHKYQVGGRGAVFVLIILFLLYMLNFADRAIMSIVVEPMKQALQFTDAQIGATQSIFLLGVALLMIPGSILVERWSRRKMLGVMAIIWSLATLATGLGSKLWQVLTARFVVGIGEAGYNPGGTAWLSLAFSKEVRGRILGFFQSATELGRCIGLIVGGWLVSLTGDWRVPFYVFAVPGVILGICTFFLPDYATIREKGEGIVNKKFFADIIKLFKIKTYNLLIVAQSFYAFVTMTIIGWLPALLIRSFGISEFEAGMVTGLVGLVILISGPLGGFWGDRWQKKKFGGRVYFLALSMLLYALTATLLILATGTTLNIYIIAALVTVFCSGLVLPGLFAIWTDVIPPQNRTTGIGMGTMISLIVAAPAPMIVGRLSDVLGGGASGLRTAFLTIMPVAFMAAIIYFVMSKYYPSDAANISDEVYAER